MKTIACVFMLLIISVILEVDGNNKDVNKDVIVNFGADTLGARSAVSSTKKPHITCKPNEVYKKGKCRRLVSAD